MTSDVGTSSVRIGFVPLVDAATIIMAKEKGVFDKYGLNVKLEKVSSWAQAMKERPLTAKALKKLVVSRANNGQPPLKFAMVYPFSSHNYQLRYWLAAAGIHPRGI